MKRIPFSRRAFIGTTAAAAGATAFPTIIPSHVLGEDAPSKRIQVGAIGCGRIGREADIPGTLKAGGQIVAVCDIDRKRAGEGQQFVLDWYTKNKRTPGEIEIFTEYREMLKRKDIDAVTVSTPDHWHALPVVDAVRAGKHVYVQKPAGRLYHEGLAMVKAAKENPKSVIQFGTQQRSSSQFREACELVRNGRIGKLKEVLVGLPTDPSGGKADPMPVPEQLNYDAWLGWTPEAPYTVDRVHPVEGYSRPGWLRCEQYCCGMITGWGVHHMDIVHWGMDTERTGPVSIKGKGTFPTSGLWTVHGSYSVEAVYANGVTVKISDDHPNGVRFVGEEGWIFVSRGGQKATASDPTSPNATLKALDASKPELLEKMTDPKVRLYVSRDHYSNWLESIRTGEAPICPIEVGHRSTGVCNIGHIAMRLGRELKWDAAAERFTGDDEANTYLSQTMRPAYAV